MAETNSPRFWRLLDTMEFETLPLFSRPLLTWNLHTDYVGRRLIYRPETESTQQDAVRMLDRMRLTAGAILLAESQSLGVGGAGRTWIAPPDTGLQFTLVLFPTPTAARSLLYVTLLAVAGALEDVAAARGLALRPDLKWPNDVLLDGRKVASVFIDSVARDEGDDLALVGVGMNVGLDTSVYPAIAEYATSLREATGLAVPREEALAAFCNRFEPLYEEAAAGGRAPFEAWRDRLVTLGRSITLRGIAGTAVAVEADGSLVVEQPDGGRVRIPPAEAPTSAQP